MQATLSNFIFYESRLTNELDQNASGGSYDRTSDFTADQGPDNNTTPAC